MKKFVFIILLVLSGGSILAQDTDNTLSPEEFASGWELLFDGETMKGWKAYNGGKQAKSWSVDDNALYCDGTQGGDDLMTIKSFRDFDLKFEWKIGEGGNSGVIYMTREGKQWSRPYLTGPEYQVYGEGEGAFDKHSVGSIFDVYEVSESKKVKPAMEWNSGRIRLSDGMITHWVNGKIVLQCQLYSEDWNKRVAGSKWKDKPYFGKSPYGHIDFQNHGNKVWFRNVKILEL